MNAVLAFLKSRVQKELFNFFTMIISNKKFGLAFAHSQRFMQMHKLSASLQSLVLNALSIKNPLSIRFRKNPLLVLIYFSQFSLAVVSSPYLRQAQHAVEFWIVKCSHLAFFFFPSLSGSLCNCSASWLKHCCFHPLCPFFTFSLMLSLYAAVLLAKMGLGTGT